MEEKIWFALVGVTPIEGNELTPNASGAYVRIACKLSTSDLEVYLREVFNNHHYSIFEITDIKSEDELNDDDKNNQVTQELIAEINGGLEFVWSTFHTWA